MRRGWPRGVWFFAAALAPATDPPDNHADDAEHANVGEDPGGAGWRYGPASGTREGRAAVVGFNSLVPDQRGVPGQFLQPYYRDFFSVLARNAP
jgi:hypothetical protein